MSRKVDIIRVTPEENAQITAAALSDPDAQPLSDEELAQFKRRVGRPALVRTKVSTNIRLDPDVLNAFKSTGAGWQTRMNEALHEWAKERGLLKI